MNEVMVFNRKEVQMHDFKMPYRVSVPLVGVCEIVLGGEKMEMKEV